MRAPEHTKTLTTSEPYMCINWTSINMNKYVKSVRYKITHTVTMLVIIKTYKVFHTQYSDTSANE